MRRHAREIATQSVNDDPSAENKEKNKWARFLPLTNVLWLEYLLYTLLLRSNHAVLVGSSETARQLQEKLYFTLDATYQVLVGEKEGVAAPRSARDLMWTAGRLGLVRVEDVDAMKRGLGR